LRVLRLACCRPLVESLDLYHNGIGDEVDSLGTHAPIAGQHRLMIQIVGANEKANTCRQWGIDHVKVQRID
jgi:hypothetical protein